MPSIIDYSVVVERLQSQGMVCNYHNSGAFAFGKGAQTHAVGWIGPDDPTIRPAARAFVHSVAPPYEPTLAALAGAVWEQHLNGPVWVMPMSHWAYELEFGSAGWLPAVLGKVALASDDLASRNNAAAIQFVPGEMALFQMLIQSLLESLDGSDFLMAFPGKAAICIIHHHKQLWWTTSDPNLAQTLETMALPRA